MPIQDNSAHLALWLDRLQDTIDDQLNTESDAESQLALRAHLDDCAVCRDEHARLLALHTRLTQEFNSKPALSVHFATGVLARIDAQQQARRTVAKQRAEQAFRQRIRAFKLDWRELWQRHAGNVIAALTVLAAAAAALSSTLESAREQLDATFETLPWTSGAMTLPLAIVAVSASIAAASLWWLRSKTR